jgi:mono/diheme cytochrome c family protein
LAILASFFLFGSLLRAQDATAGEKTYKAKCASCHGQNAEGKPAMKAPAIKGKSADDIQKQITTSPKHAGVKNLTAAESKDLAAYLATLK